MSSLALRPAHLLFENSRPQITPAPLPLATKAHGQLLGRDFNPLDMHDHMLTGIIKIISIFRRAHNNVVPDDDDNRVCPIFFSRISRRDKAANYLAGSQVML